MQGTRDTNRSSSLQLGAAQGRQRITPQHDVFRPSVSVEVYLQWFMCDGRVKERRRMDWPYTRIYDIPVRTVECSIGPDIAGGQQE
jgi:hypothetical protein